MMQTYRHQNVKKNRTVLVEERTVLVEEVYYGPIQWRYRIHR
jgi:hypothetical protein